MSGALGALINYDRTREGRAYWELIRNQFAKKGTTTLPDHGHAAPTPEETKPKPPSTMDYSNAPIARPTLIHGEDVATMTERRCIQLIQDNKASAKALVDLGVESRTLNARIAEYAAVNTELVRRLDSFTPPAPATAE